MWIMIAGPYTTNGASAQQRQQNLNQMNIAAFEVLKRGHTPVIGVNMALPIIQAVGKQHFDEVMMPVSLELARRCDACLRIGGPSQGADAEAEILRQAGKPVYANLDDVPTAGE